MVVARLVRKSLVPKVPLTRDDESHARDEVGHLRYLLTGLGFLKQGDTDKLIGIHDEKNERGVPEFHEMHKIWKTKCRIQYDDSDETNVVVRQLVRDEHILF